MEYFLSNPPCLSVPVSDADKLLGCSNLLCLKLYLYLLRSGKSVTLQRAAEDLNLSQTDLRAAAKELKSKGLMSIAGKGTPAPEQTIPEYEKSYVAKRSMEDRNFQSLQLEAAQILGHTLSAQELNTLFGIYDYLGLPAEVICMLLVSCMEDIQEKYGPGRLPTMRQIEKQAYVWANQEIMTLDQAEDYLAHRRSQKDKVQEVKRAMGIWDRALTKTENDYIMDWLNKGYGTEAIAMAFDRTVTQTGSLKLAYMNKIILNWHKKGLHTVQEIIDGDKPQGKAAAQPATSAARTPGGEKERLMKIFEDISK